MHIFDEVMAEIKSSEILKAEKKAELQVMLFQ
jgi:hypothetical protein